MEDKSSQKEKIEKEKKELPPLPEDNDPFWSGAEKHVFNLGKPVTCKEHYFLRVSGTEVKCKYCPAGTMVLPVHEVRDGHIYIHGSLLI